MTRDVQLACSLKAADLRERLATIRSIGKDALHSVSPEGVLRFRADRATRERLDAAIAAESACCPFLAFDLREDAGELVLTITAPEGGEVVASELVNAFAAGPQRPARS